jgi:hypothetical protein
MQVAASSGQSGSSGSGGSEQEDGEEDGEDDEYADVALPGPGDDTEVVFVKEGVAICPSRSTRIVGRLSIIRQHRQEPPAAARSRWACLLPADHPTPPHPTPPRRAGCCS